MGRHLEDLNTISTINQWRKPQMYGKIGTGVGATGGTLAFTGTGLNSLALIVAGTTLIAASLAIWKLAPRRIRKH